MRPSRAHTSGRCGLGGAYEVGRTLPSPPPPINTMRVYDNPDFDFSAAEVLYLRQLVNLATSTWFKPILTFAQAVVCSKKMMLLICMEQQSII